MTISKYYWELNDTALRQVGKILRTAGDSRFIPRLVTLLSRCDKPKEVFKYISKADFIANWPKVRAYWIKNAPVSDFRDWWETIYEHISSKGKSRIAGANFPEEFARLGRMIKEARIKQGLSQRDFAMRAGLKQPDVSDIEKGKKNITIKTLISISKVLNLRTSIMW
jgi:DNA-binding XRE family transcriptional regulator